MLRYRVKQTANPNREKTMIKIVYIFKELFYMIRRHKMYFFAPLFIVLALIAFLVYYIGPAAIVSFIYAGV